MTQYLEEVSYKVEGNIIYPDGQMLTWGPFYYHLLNNAITKMDNILENITNWCNEQDPKLNIKPQNIKKVSRQMSFDIQAWKNNNTLENCTGIITTDTITFED